MGSFGRSMLSRAAVAGRAALSAPRSLPLRSRPGGRRRGSLVTAGLAVSLVAVFCAPGVRGDSAAVSCGANASSSGAACTISAPGTDGVRIDQRFVAGGFYEYQSIVFQPGDVITLNAGGCVQTGGSGDTWKRYVNPSGSNSGPPDKLYFGTVYIPGAFYADDHNKPVNGAPISEFVLGQKHQIRIDTLGLPTDATQHLDLRLGYRDDQYDDNGYYRHDDGNHNQCALSNDGGSAL